MIAQVNGTVLERRAGHVVLDCNGVGYRLEVSAQTLKSVPGAGKEIQLHSHLIARDDGLSLYGFASEDERELFLKLISVAGIGPRVGLAVLSGATTRDLIKAIAIGDAKRFQAVPGVGKKTAERIVMELKEKVADGMTTGEGQPAGYKSEPRLAAREGLVGLGFALAEAESMLDGVASEGKTTEQLIEAALKTVGAAGSG